MNAASANAGQRSEIDEVLGDQRASFRRFLLHVLPPGFVKLRHYGLLAPGNVNTKLVAAKALLAATTTTTTTAALAPMTATSTSTDAAAKDAPEDWRVLLLRITGRDVTRCPACGGALRPQPLIAPRARPVDTS